MSPSGGRGRGKGRGRPKKGEGGDVSPEWLPPRQQKEFETTRVTRSSRAGGLVVQQQGGGADEEGERERLALKFHRQQGDIWAPGPNIGAERAVASDFFTQQSASPSSQGAGGGSANQTRGSGKGSKGNRGRGGGVGQTRNGSTRLNSSTQPNSEGGGDEGGEDLGSQQGPSQPLPLPAAFDLPTLEEAHTTHIPTLKHVPKAAKGDFARELASLWHNLGSDTVDDRLWLLESIFARCILPAGRGKRIADAYSQSRVVKERLRRWRAGEYRQLWDEAVQVTKKRPKKSSKARRYQGDFEEKSAEERNADRAAALAGEGEYARAVQALGSAGMAPRSAATEAELRRKHPSGSSPLANLPTTEVAPLTLTKLEVRKSVDKFGRGKAAGPSGLRAEHVKVALSGPPNRSDRALTGLTKLVNAMVAGGVPESVAPFLCGARLHAALKRDGSIRPIAVGNLLRRLVARCIARSVASKAAAYLSPLQLGVGVPGACEAIVHAARQALEKNPNKLLLQVDFMNAFNCAERGSTLQDVAELFPEMLAWCLTCYGQPTHLQYGQARLLSTMGWHQGDALASLLFALTLQPIALLIQEQLPNVDLHAWFLDDGTLVGTEEELQQVVDIILKEGPARGLHLSTSHTSTNPKSALWSPLLAATGGGNDDPLQRGVPLERGGGVTLLGAPIGQAEFVRDTVKRKVEKIGDTIALLPLLKDPQTEYVLLRSCLALPKVSFLLRTVNTSYFASLLKQFDALVREALIRILGAPVDDPQWLQAKLPISLGGMGLRGAEDHASSAHVSSLLSSYTLTIQLQGGQDENTTGIVLPQQLLEDISLRTGEDASVESLWGLSQKMLSFKVDNQNLSLLMQQLENGASVREVARLKSLGLPYSGAWLLTPPIPALGLHLKPSEFTLAARYRLGINVYDGSGPCPACLQPSDSLGDHALCCGHYGERITRHNQIRDQLFSLAQGAALGPVREGRFLLPGSEKRPADIFIPSWAEGLDCALDVTVINPLQDSTVVRAAAEPGHALGVAYGRKMRGAEEQCLRQGIRFMPVVAETLGGWDTAAIREIKKLAAAKARHLGNEEDEEVRKAFGRLSILLMRGNSAILANRIPTQE